MNKLYKTMVGYNPCKKQVTFYRHLTYDEAIDPKLSDDAFYGVFEAIDPVKEMVVGITIAGNYYQLSPANYKTYIKENSRTMEHIHKGALLTAIIKYKEEKHIPLDEDW